MRLSQIMMLLGGKFTSSDFTFTGSYEWVQEDDNNWHLLMKSDGDFTAKKSTNIDIFCVGGGGGGGSAMENRGYGGGGGGGYGSVVSGVGIPANIAISVTIGQGGAAGRYGGGYNTPGGDGGSSSFGTLCIAQGGKGALGANGQTTSGGAGGNNGGSGRD